MVGKLTGRGSLTVIESEKLDAIQVQQDQDDYDQPPNAEMALYER